VQVQQSLSGGYRAARERLAKAGTLVAEDGKYTFATDALFSSPSQAAAVIVGYAINGREAWKSKDGRTWGTIENARLSTGRAP
jgi:hypothetical protein